MQFPYIFHFYRKSIQFTLHIVNAIYNNIYRSLTFKLLFFILNFAYIIIHCVYWHLSIYIFDCFRYYLERFAFPFWINLFRLIIYSLIISTVSQTFANYHKSLNLNLKFSFLLMYHFQIIQNIFCSLSINSK